MILKDLHGVQCHIVFNSLMYHCVLCTKIFSVASLLRHLFLTNTKEFAKVYSVLLYENYIYEGTCQFFGFGIG